MNFTTEIFNSILQDIYVSKKTLGGIASRLVTMENGIEMVYAINLGSRLREAYVLLERKPDKFNFPKWHGTSIDIVQLPAYSVNQYYIRLLQLPQSEDYIFDIIIDDLHTSLEKTSDITQCLSTVVSILQKWKIFFQTEKELVLSDEMQEGLYGELIFLEKSILRRSLSDIYCWAGCNKESHDFYFSIHAVEVKTSSRREPYSTIISSEYQLDTNDIKGRLFLLFMAVRKSYSSGEKLPDIIERIRNLLDHDISLITQFNNKLREYGYLDEVADLYTTGFSIRDFFYFEIKEGFPKIIRSMYQLGISKVKYELAISQCMSYECNEDRVFAILKGVAGDAKQ